MHAITRALLAVINGLAQFGAHVRAYLLALHINALTALVQKHDEEAAAANRGIDRAIARAAAADIKADAVARAAEAEANTHGVSLGA
jgi:hypothetical protein